MKKILIIAVFAISFATIAENVAEPELTLNAQPAESMALNPGDILKITVIQHEELSLEVRVDSQWNFKYPFCGRINVKNRSLYEIEDELSIKLKKFDIENAEVAIFVKEFVPRFVYVFGEVEKPQSIQFMPGMNITAMQAISTAEGLTEKADMNNVFILRNKNNKLTKIKFNMLANLKSTNIKSLFLIPGDTVVVSSGKPFSVLGKVKSAGSFNMHADLPVSMTQAIAMAGGFDKLADREDIRLIRNGQVSKIDLSTALESNANSANDPVIKPGDIIFVTETRW